MESTKYMKGQPVKVSPYIGYLASGSDISNPEVDSGYDPALVRELARVSTKGGTVHLTANAMRDFAEWLDSVGNAEAQIPNPSGARSCANLAEKLRSTAVLGAE